MTNVTARSYKEVNLAGGTLVVSVPHLGVGGLLITDFILEQLQMDQVACLDSDDFPPIAMLRRGKPRFPARIHADPASKVSVLRCEFNPPPILARPMARATLAWAKAQSIERVLSLDGLMTVRNAAKPASTPEILFAASRDDLRMRARQVGIREYGEGIVGGVSAMLLLESRFAGPGLLGLFAVFEDPVQDARSSLGFANALRRLLPELRFDQSDLEARIQELDEEVRTLQEGAERAVERLLRRPKDTSPMYG